MASTRNEGRWSRDNSTTNVSAGSRRSAGSILRGKGRTTASPRNSTSSSGRRSNNLFRAFFAQRNNDYRSDAAHQYSQGTTQQPRQAAVPAARRPSDGRSSPVPDPSEADDNSRCFCGACPSPSPRFLHALSTIITSRIWRVIIVFNTVLLLFGSEIQAIAIPPAGDIVMDILYLIALAIFLTDIVMRCFLEPTYLRVPQCCNKENQDRTQNTSWGGCQLGSFLFWCDLVSTLTLFYSVSFINTDASERKTIDITTSDIGIPVAGLDEINRAIPVSLNLDVLIIVGRTARAARFIQRTTFKRANSKYNAYWFLRCNPFWHLDRYRQRRNTQMLNRQASQMSSESNSDHAASMRTSGKITRSPSWGTLQMAIMAKTRSREQEKEKPRGVKGVTLHVLRKMGLAKNAKHEEFRRQIAATKIQRAWRATVAQSTEVGNDVAWVGQRGSVRSTAPSNGKKKYQLWRSAEALSNASKHSSQASSRVRRPESQVGSAMRELTAQRVALGIILALILTVLFTYSEDDATRPSAMIVLHTQTANEDYAAVSLNAARASSIPDLYQYKFANGTVTNFTVPDDENPATLREREKVEISVTGSYYNEANAVVEKENDTTVGLFAFRRERINQAWVEICTTLFVLFIWLFGVTAFAGPVMTLVVIPIERMVRLLGMLMMDPLGYQSTSRYKKFVAEENEITQYTQWTKEQLKGMETSFLMSTILRIGSLMKVGFGSAGVEIIRNNLETGQSKNMLILNSQGSTVSCIFLFCDIRQFTDATECLQEEVFVFTNRIAGVVHSICHSYGGSANKNVGDAFLLSWLLEDGNSKHEPNPRSFDRGQSDSFDDFSAKHSQADKALLSVVKISIALNHDQYYLEPLSDSAREALLSKVSKRKGPVVQMGCGLHAGKAVQGAIGSQRKIDATYVSEAVERAEFLESSTKKYGLKMLMSDSFHRLLHPSNRRRCRKIDQILLKGEDDDDEDAPMEDGDFMELFTFDMDIDALWRPVPKTVTKAVPTAAAAGEDHASDTDSQADSSNKGSRRDLLRTASVRGPFLPRRRSIRVIKTGGKQNEDANSEEMKTDRGITDVAAAVITGAGNMATGGTADTTEEVMVTNTPELILPTGPALYNSNVWLSEDMRRIRQLYSDGLFFQKFNSGFLAYYAKDWEHATQCFQTILERFDDGPSRYFLNLINENNGVPPRDFKPYGVA